MIKVGIFFGGASREREVSFAGGRTVYDNLDKSLFQPVLVFVDSLGRFIQLDWQYAYKGSIRDFYPPVDHYPAPDYPYQVYVESLSADAKDQCPEAVGRQIYPHQFHALFDFAFLALHGPKGEDGTLQGMLEWQGIPYSGEGIFTSGLGISKALQKQLFRSLQIKSPDYLIVDRQSWAASPDQIIAEAREKVGFPLVIKSSFQGSSIGVNILEDDDPERFRKFMERSFFRLTWHKSEWDRLSRQEKRKFVTRISDIREGLGMPILANETQISDPLGLEIFLDQTQETQLMLEATNAETQVVIEQFVAGREFSCIVITDEQGVPFALPPTEIKKGKEVFNYRAKYLPGISRKVTPIDAPDEVIEKIRAACSSLFTSLQAQVYTRIDGFYTSEGDVFLNDPNTTSGMMPSSFFFHQAAEVGLNPSQFLTLIIERSLKARMQTPNTLRNAQLQLQILDKLMRTEMKQQQEMQKVAVILGGYSAERHISVESGRNIYEKLFSAGKYLPVPFFLQREENALVFYQLPINLLLKDNADDIAARIAKGAADGWIIDFRKSARPIQERFIQGFISDPIRLSLDELAEQIDFAFIALHGRPGEDGELQGELEKVGIPYNGSGVESSQLTINKYRTNELLAEHQIPVARHLLVTKDNWNAETREKVEEDFGYPLIAKPTDDGCSAAVKKIKNREELDAFAEMIFRSDYPLLKIPAQKLNLQLNEEFPVKQEFLVETLIDSRGAERFLEITGGMLTHRGGDQVNYEVFEASEALATGDVLSLEEKFLAGEGQNITPARYASGREENEKISSQVKKQLEKVARLVNVEGYARIDAFVRVYSPEEIEIIIIEVNSLPGMTPATVIFHQSALNGYKPFEFLHKIIEYGFQKKQLTEKI